MKAKVMPSQRMNDKAHKAWVAAIKVNPHITHLGHTLGILGIYYKISASSNSATLNFWSEAHVTKLTAFATGAGKLAH